MIYPFSFVNNILKNRSLTIFLFFLAINLFFFSGHIGGDALWNYYTAESIVLDGNFNLADSIREIDVKGLKDGFKELSDGIKHDAEIYGRVYSKYGLGNVLVGTLFYGIGLLFVKVFPFLPKDYFLIFVFALQNVFIVSLSALIFYKLITLFLNDKKISLFLTIGFSFGTIIFPYALKSGFGEPLALLVILLGFYFLVLYNHKRKLMFLFLSGFLTGSCILTKIYTVLVFPAFFIFLFFTIEDKKIKDISTHFFVFLSGFIIPIIMFFIYNYLRFGSVFESGYSVRSNEGTLSGEMVPNLYYFFVTFYNILLSPGRGLLIFNPLIILSFLGLKNLFKNHKKLFVFYITLTLSYLLFFSFSYHWASSVAWGTRYFIPILGILIFPAIFIFENITETAKKKFTKALYIFIIAGMLVQLPSVLMNYSKFEMFLQKECPHYIYTRISLPQYSQIVGGYYQMFSGVHRVITGKSLDFPLILTDTEDIEKLKNEKSKYYLFGSNLGIIVWKSLSGYDWFDLWFLHLFKLEFATITLKIFAVIIVAFLIFSSISFYKKIRTF